MENFSQLKKTARTAGAFYLLMAITSILGLMYIPTNLIVKEDAVKTVNNIQNNELLFRFGILGILIGQVAFIFLALYLHRLFSNVNRHYSDILKALVISAVPVAFLNTLNLVAVLILLENKAYLGAFDQNQLNSIIMFLLDLFDYGTKIAGLFWGLWLFPFGILVYKSKFLPRILGILLLVSGISYVIDFSSFLILPHSYDTIVNIITLPMTLGEMSTMFWLVIVGVRNVKEKTK